MAKGAPRLAEPGPPRDDLTHPVSLPLTARDNDTVSTEPETRVCPRCRTPWPQDQAPALCPKDGSALVRAKELAEVDNDPMVGRTLEGRYTILARLGAGSMGTVYRAKQHAMGREVAIKILRSDRAADDTSKQRFMREARANSLLASPNTVTVFDFGQSESGEFYLAMELLEGESLGQRLTRAGRLPPAIAVDAARQALRSLAEAHAKGIIHRDLKPDNLFFARVTSGGPTTEEIVKVLDFGIAKMMRDDDSAPMGVVETQAGTVFGTPRYMSPEQAQGKPLDATSDLYSLGVIVYQMLTGRPPFTDNDAVVVMARHIKSYPKRPNEACPEASIPKELEDVVMRSLAKDPKDRQPSAEVFAGELLTALEAQGALTSGVRSSVTNAAGIALPDSMRPPPVPLPKLKTRIPPFVLVLAPVLVVVAIAGVVLGVRSAPKPAPPPAVTAPSAPATTAAAVPASTSDVPTVTPESLPKAHATAAPKTHPATKPVPAPPGKPRASASGKPAAPVPSPSSTTPYGIFE
jgi:serine/threonine-protein kinase